MVENFETTMNQVERILRKNKLTRKDDYLLFLEVCEENAPDICNFSLSYVLKNHVKLGLPSWETVSRARRKVQELCPELVDEEVAKKKKLKAEEIRKYINRVPSKKATCTKKDEIQVSSNDIKSTKNEVSFSEKNINSVRISLKNGEYFLQIIDKDDNTIVYRSEDLKEIQKKLNDILPSVSINLLNDKDFSIHLVDSLNNVNRTCELFSMLNLLSFWRQV